VRPHQDQGAAMAWKNPPKSQELRVDGFRFVDWRGQLALTGSSIAYGPAQ
jgi:hypothetical protein